MSSLFPKASSSARRRVGQKKNSSARKKRSLRTKLAPSDRMRRLKAGYRMKRTDRPGTPSLAKSAERVYTNKQPGQRSRSSERSNRPSQSGRGGERSKVPVGKSKGETDLSWKLPVRKTSGMHSTRRKKNKGSASGNVGITNSLDSTSRHRTIAKFIHRFRNEQPRSPQERQQLNQVEPKGSFWWEKQMQELDTVPAAQQEATTSIARGSGLEAVARLRESPRESEVECTTPSLSSLERLQELHKKYSPSACKLASTESRNVSGESNEQSSSNLDSRALKVIGLCNDVLDENQLITSATGQKLSSSAATSEAPGPSNDSFISALEEKTSLVLSRCDNLLHNDSSTNKKASNSISSNRVEISKVETSPKDVSSLPLDRDDKTGSSKSKRCVKRVLYQFDCPPYSGDLRAVLENSLNNLWDW
jgi:hypothetical protein